MSIISNGETGVFKKDHDGRIVFTADPGGRWRYFRMPEEPARICKADIGLIMDHSPDASLANASFRTHLGIEIIKPPSIQMRAIERNKILHDLIRGMRLRTMPKWARMRAVMRKAK